jgi:hypothetical protein
LCSRTRGGVRPLHQSDRSQKAAALDRWSGFVEYLRPGIEARLGDVTDLSFLASSSIDFVFASNLFEHISQDDFASVLRQLSEFWYPAVR